MTDKKETPEGGPCPPVDDAGVDEFGALEALADYDAEETNAKEVPSA